MSLSIKRSKDQRKKPHLRNSSALSAAEISVTFPFGIYEQQKQQQHIQEFLQTVLPSLVSEINSAFCVLLCS